MKEIIKNFLTKKGIEIKRYKNINDRAHYVELYGEESVKNRRFYNIGAGAHYEFGVGFKHPLWTNIDVNRKWGKGCREYNPATDIAHDPYTLNPLPIESNSAELVHSQFSVEHLTDEVAQKLFNEIYRILKPGGYARINCPNADLTYRAYLNNDKHFFFWLKDHAHFKNASMEQIFIDNIASSTSTLLPDGSKNRTTDEELRHVLATKSFDDALNYITSKADIDYQLNHRRCQINWWNFKKFEKFLSKAGFTVIYQSQPLQSFAPVMRNEAYFDSNMYNKVIIYVEARKV